MRTSTVIAVIIAALVLLQSDVPAKAQDDSVNEVGTDIGTFYKDEEAPLYKAPGYSPYAGRNYPVRVLWGDTHLHTAKGGPGVGGLSNGVGGRLDSVAVGLRANDWRGDNYTIASAMLPNAPNRGSTWLGC